MASVTTTYGKKRSFLKSMGSRRRQKHLVESFSAKKQDIPIPTPSGELESNSLPAHRPTISHDRKDTAKHETKVDNSGLSTAIEAMASALLDDTTQQSASCRDDGSLEDMGTPLETNFSTVSGEVKSEALGSNLVKVEICAPHVPKVFTSHTPEGGSAGDKKYLTGSAVPLARAASTRPVVTAPQHWKQSSSKRPLSHQNGQSLHASGNHRLKKSCSVPLGPMGISRPPNHSHDAKTHRVQNNAEAIEKKVTAMLAATDALKPSISRVADVRTSRRSRNLGLQVFKLTNLFGDRLATHPDGSEPSTHTSPNHPECRTRDSRPAFIEREDYPSNPNMTSTIEVRLNEGDNLNRDKVRRIVGGQVTRKPVADDGKLLRHGRSIDDPFTETGKRIGGQRTLQSTGLDSFPIIPETLFESENGFDDNLSEGILSSVPLGSSTPKLRHLELSNTSWDNGYADKSVQAVGSPEMAVKASLSKPSVHFGLHRPGLVTDKSGEKRLLEIDGQCCLEPAMAGHGIYATDCKRVKKHPSPSKSDLENLEMAMRQYTIFKSMGRDEDDLDELATTSEAPFSCLTSRDKNVKMGSSSQKALEHPKESAWPSSRSLPWVPYHDAQSQLPCPPSAWQSQLGGSSRLAIPYRPSVLRTNDVDELH